MRHDLCRDCEGDYPKARCHDGGRDTDTIEKIARWLEYHAEHDKTPEQAKILRDAAVGVRKRWWDQPVIV